MIDSVMPKTGGYERTKGRKRYEPHVRLYHYMLPALMQRLSGNQLKILIYMLSFEKGDHSGVFMSVRHAAEGTGLNMTTAHLALIELDKQGFIRPTALGYFQQKGGPATNWRFTFLPFDGKAPTNEWREAAAEQKSWLEILPSTVGENDTGRSGHSGAVGEIGTVEAKSPPSPVGKKGTQTIAIGCGDDGDVLDIDQPPPTPCRGTEIGSNTSYPLRDLIARHWRQLGVDQQRAWALRHELTCEEVAAFLSGVPNALPFPKVAAMAHYARRSEV